MAIFAVMLAATLGMIEGGMGWQSAIPLLVIGGQRVHGCWQMIMTGLLQQRWLAENVLDHRLNSRTICMSPVSRFIDRTINDHVEHHMFPMVPHFSLPAQHDLTKHGLPPANPSIWQACREMYGAVLRQRREPGYHLRKEFPATAKPCREALHQAVPAGAVR